jgi:hypothetical protein
MNRVLMVIVMSLALFMTVAQESASQTAADDEPSRSAVAGNAPSKFRSAEDGNRRLSQPGLDPVTVPSSKKAWFNPFLMLN